MSTPTSVSISRLLSPRVGGWPRLYAAATLLALGLGVSSASTAAEVVVYSARNEQLIKPLFDAYTEETGVQVRFVTDGEGPLMARLKAEGKNSPADLFLTVDAGNLWQATQEGLLQSVSSTVLDAHIPSHLKDPANQWFGLSVRARTLVYNSQQVSPADLTTYEALAQPNWKQRLCLRTSKKVYNQSLVATMIKAYGATTTTGIVEGWVRNLALPPTSNDTQALEAVAAGQCDVTLVNTYYFGRLMQKKPNLPLAIFWPNQATNTSAPGVHVNVSGAGVTRYAKHREEAVRLLEWLSSGKAQSMYASVNMEYPANPAIAPTPEVAAWGRFKPSLVNVAEAGKLQAQAVMLMDRAGYK